LLIKILGEKMSSFAVGELIGRHIDRTIEMAGVFLNQHIGKGKNVALEKIQASLPSCPPEIFTNPNFHRIPSFPSAFSKDDIFSHTRQASGSSYPGWIGEKGYNPAFDIHVFNKLEQLKYKATEPVNGGLLGFFQSTKVPVTVSRFYDHAFHIIGEHGRPNKLVHEAWIEDGGMCESLTSTAATDHVFQCTKGVFNDLPLLRRACVYKHSIPDIEAAKADLPIAKIAGAALGGLCLVKAAHDFTDGHKMHGLAWAVAGVALIALPNAI